MNRESGKTGGYEAEEDDESDVPGYTGAIPVYRYGKVNEGASSCLSDHFYPNPPVSYD